MHFQAAFHHLLMQSKSWKQKREASSLHTSSQGSVEKQWHREKQSQRAGQQKVPHRSSVNNKNYTWLPSLETLITSLGTFSPSHKPAHTKQLPCIGILAPLVTVNAVFPWEAVPFLPEDEFPRIFVVPCFLYLAARGCTWPREGFAPQIAMERLSPI